MSDFPFTRADVKELCGNTSYSRGMQYCRENRVIKIEVDPNTDQCTAVVKGSSRYHVRLKWSADGGDVEAECSCPAFEVHYSYCKHVAAVMLALVQSPSFAGGRVSTRSAGPSLAPPTLFSGSSKPSRPAAGPAAPQLFTDRDLHITNQFFALFNRANPSSRETEEESVALSQSGMQEVGVEFICVISVESAYHACGVELELKVGPKRLYVVSKIKDFLSKLEQREKIVFSKNFTFDPSIHSFSKANESVLDLLVQIKRSEEFYNADRSHYSFYRQDRSLRIPPLAWPSLRDRLVSADAVLLTNGVSRGSIQMSTEKIPLAFELDQASAGKAYRLAVNGLDKVGVLPEYGFAVVDGKLVEADPDELRRIAQMQKWFVQSHVLPQAKDSRFIIPPKRMNDFLERVVPGLKSIGTVKIARGVADRIVQPPLKAKLYLDREGDCLSVKLNFVYDETVIDPHSQEEVRTDSDVFLVREAEKERQILRILEASPFYRTVNGLQLIEEESIYEFLYERIPLLEQVAEVFATPAVRALTHPAAVRPRTSVDIGDSEDWLEIRFDMAGIDQGEIRRILQSLVEKKRYYRLPDGAFVSLEQDGLREVAGMLSDMDVRKSEIKGSRIELPVVRGLRISSDLSAGKGAGVKWGAAFRRFLEQMRSPSQLDFPIPDSLSGVLRDYQKEGFQWLKTLSLYRFGGILADDMGLGKTLQSIAYILSEQQENVGERLPALIVSPASLIYNWQSEFGKFAPQLRVTVVAGTPLERDGLQDESVEADVIVTSYPLLRRDIEYYEKRRFGILILDEAQAFKNRASQTAQAVKRIAAGRRFALTGTPIENRLDELWSIFDAVFPGLFENQKAFSAMPPDKIARIIRPFVLRRMKSEVLTELPEKIESVQHSELTVKQKKLYAAYLDKLRAETEEDLREEGFQKSRMKILAGLTRLRQICCHPALFLEDYHETSGKLEQLTEIVRECLENGRRMLIFSQFTSMLAIIREHLAADGLTCSYLDGSTPAAERLELCDRFNQGENDIFLISLKAGGTGLNLTGADTVILFDLWWNPAVEQQAADRAYRLGQKNVVQVMRLIARGTIEEKMYELQQRKKDIANEVIQSGGAQLSSLSESDIRELLSISG